MKPKACVFSEDENFPGVFQPRDGPSSFGGLRWLNLFFLDGAPLHLLPAGEDALPSATAEVGRRYVSQSLVVAAVVVEVHKAGHGLWGAKMPSVSGLTR